MKRCSSILLLATVVTVFADDKGGYVPPFNGRDLTGWVNAYCAPETWSVRDGMIHCTGRPTGAMRTERQYENFILEVEWRHLTGATILSQPVGEVSPRSAARLGRIPRNVDSGKSPPQKRGQVCAVQNLRRLIRD